jgi:hypothetical protein
MIISIQFQNSPLDQKINFINGRDDIFLEFQFHLLKYNFYFLFKNAKIFDFIFALFLEDVVGGILFFDICHGFYVELILHAFHQVPAGDELFEKLFWQIEILGNFCEVFEGCEFYF